MVEGLVGWIRRNVMVPIPRVDSIDELNEVLLKRCLKYRKHKIDRRELTVGQMVDIEKPKLTSLPTYRFDTSKGITAMVDSFSTIKFDYNFYSVPVTYVDKDVSIKGYGNEVIVIHKQDQVAIYPRCYGRGEALYRLEHYIDLIEQRPRSVFNAKPVKSTVSSELIAIGKLLSGPREMVKLLRLCVDYGEDKVRAAANHLKIQEKLSLEQIRAYLMPFTPVSPSSHRPDEIKVKHTGLAQYDTLIQGDVAI